MNIYKIPKERVIYEILNTEAILIDFDTGNYFALLGVAKEIWQLIEHEVSIERIGDLLSQAYHLNVESDLKTFIDQLLENRLIEPSDSFPVIQKDCPEMHLSETTYSPPVVQKYTDVQNLLLLDPIHEVSEIGWPEHK